MIPPRMKHYLDKHRIQSRILSHEWTETLAEAAEVLGIRQEALAKAVLVVDDLGVFAVAMIPFHYNLDLERLILLAERPMTLVEGLMADRPFVDCEPGSHPPIGKPYNLETFVDISLRDLPEVYFEVGSHTCLVQLKQDDFQYLTADVSFGHIIEAPFRDRNTQASFLQKIFNVVKNRDFHKKKKAI